MPAPPALPLPTPLPGGADWYRVEAVHDGLTLITEPFVDEFLRANLWLVRGDHQTLLIDAGLGVAPLRPLVSALLGADGSDGSDGSDETAGAAECAVVLTHGHLDHAGAAHEFAERWGHPADEVVEDRAISLLAAEHAAALGMPPEELEVDGDWLLSRRPDAGFDPRAYRQPAAPLTRRLADGERLDLGGTALEVLSLPGHTPGSIALYDADRRELFSGDVVYDDELLDSLPESDPAAYRRSLLRLRELPVELVHPGHGPDFGGERLVELIDAYLAR